MNQRSYNYLKNIIVLLSIPIAMGNSLVLEAVYVAYATISNKACEKLLEDSLKSLKINNPKANLYATTSIAYFARPNLKAATNRFSDQIEAIGSSYFNKIFHTILKRELDYAKTHQVFYHGQMRELMLTQDLYAALYKEICGKLLHNFVVLRHKDKSLEEFKTVIEFEKAFIKTGEIFVWAFDCLPHIRKQLLSVNVALFGNNPYGDGQCTFHYFITSTCCKSLNVIDVAEEMFAQFSLQDAFVMCKANLYELCSLLATLEPDKTGVLLQIFIPHKLVDTIAYRSKKCGMLYYKHSDPTSCSVSQDLQDYRSKNTWLMNDELLDTFQCRLLLNPTLVNPSRGVKIFRYCKETENVLAYQKKLAALTKKIGQKKELQLMQVAHVNG